MSVLLMRQVMSERIGWQAKARTMSGRATAGFGKIPFAKICCDGNEWNYLREVVESGWLTTAGKTHQFEQEFARAVGARFALAVNSCTAALHLGLEALGV